MYIYTHIYRHIYIYMYIYLSIYLSIDLSISLSIYPSIYLSINIYKEGEIDWGGTHRPAPEKVRRDPERPGRDDKQHPKQ